MIAKPRQWTQERIAEQMAALDRDYSFGERLEAARALGREDYMPSPQEEMELTQGEPDGR